MGHIDHLMLRPKRCRSFGTAFLVGAVAILFASTKNIDVPGPMEPSKPEFTCEFSTPFALFSGVLTLAGISVIVSSSKGGQCGLECFGLRLKNMCPAASSTLLP
jgi:hypothetical protein